MTTKVDINCDLGESYGAFKVGNDEQIMDYVTSANIACGFHAGDPLTIAHTTAMAKRHDVAVGAHPGFPDLMGFGRREMDLTAEEVGTYVTYQIGALHGFLKQQDIIMQHVKPHGALYNMASIDRNLADAIVSAILAFNKKLIFFAPPKSALAVAASEAGVTVANEFFADRAYEPDGNLVSRKKSNSLIHEPQQVVKRAITAITESKVASIKGKDVNLGKIHTICVHGDTLNAVELAKSLKQGLIRAGIEVSAAGNFL